MSEPLRSRDARRLAETALVRIVDAYGTVPEFVLLGGLVPDLLCSRSSTLHVGTTDVDVQVNLEIAGGSANAARLEAALHTAGFTPDHQRVWRWQDHSAPGLVVKAEFLADLDDVPNQATVNFDGCEQLGAVNLRGTGFATRDWQLRPLTAPGPNDDITGETRTALDDLAGNFAGLNAQGPQAYAETMLDLHPEHDWDLLTNDAITAIEQFTATLGV